MKCGQQLQKDKCDRAPIAIEKEPFFSFVRVSFHFRIAKSAFLKMQCKFGTVHKSVQIKSFQTLFLANVGFDTAEKGPLKVCQKVATM